MDQSEILLELSRLRAENARLNIQRETNKKAKDTRLPVFSEYDTKLFVCMEDIQRMLLDSKIDDSANDMMARMLVKMFKVEPQAQLRTADSSGRGKGRYLYFRTEITAILGIIAETSA